MKIIYFAGGWFSPQQEEEHTRIGTFLKQQSNLIVFDPKEGGMFKCGKDSDKMSNILKNNCFAIDNSDLVVAITDYKDMGTLWETGYAYAKKRPMIYYCETLGDKPFNLMLAKTGKVARNVDELKKLLDDPKTYEFLQIHQYDGEIE